MSKFDKSVTDVLICKTSHPHWVLPGGHKVNLTQPQKKATLLRLASTNSAFEIEPEVLKQIEAEKEKSVKSEQGQDDKSSSTGGKKANPPSIGK